MRRDDRISQETSCLPTRGDCRSQMSAFRNEVLADTCAGNGMHGIMTRESCDEMLVGFVCLFVACWFDSHRLRTLEDDIT
jgi:hypothetical protein